MKQWKAFIEDMKGIRQAKKNAPAQKTSEKKKRSRLQEETEEDHDHILIEEEEQASDNRQPIISSFADRDDMLTPQVQKISRSMSQILFKKLYKALRLMIQGMNRKKLRL